MDDFSNVISLFDRALENSEDPDRSLDPTDPADACWIGASTAVVLLTSGTANNGRLTPEQKYQATRGALVAARELWRANSGGQS